MTLGAGTLAPLLSLIRPGWRRERVVRQDLYRCLVRARVSCAAISHDGLDSQQRWRLMGLHDHVARATAEAAAHLPPGGRCRVNVQTPAPARNRVDEVEESLLAAADRLATLHAVSADSHLTDDLCIELLQAAALLPLGRTA